MNAAEGHELAYAIRPVEDGAVADDQAPVAADQPEVANADLVEEIDDIARHSVPAVAVLGSLRPAHAAQIWADHAVALRQRLDHMPPAPPVLRPAVQKHDRI